MGKMHVDHRIVVRDKTGNIVREESATSFVDGKPIFDLACKALEDGQVAYFQHGARIIFRSH